MIEDVSAKTEECSRTYPQFSNLMSTTKKTFVSIYLKMRVCLAIDTEHGTRLRSKQLIVRKHFIRALQRYFTGNKHNSLHLERKYARIFVLRHYLFFQDHSFPRAKLEQMMPAAENTREQISGPIFMPKWRLFIHHMESLLLFVGLMLVVRSQIQGRLPPALGLIPQK